MYVCECVRECVRECVCAYMCVSLSLPLPPSFSLSQPPNHLRLLVILVLWKGVQEVLDSLWRAEVKGMCSLPPLRTGNADTGTIGRVQVKVTKDLHVVLLGDG